MSLIPDINNRPAVFFLINGGNVRYRGPRVMRAAKITKNVVIDSELPYFFLFFEAISGCTMYVTKS